MSKITISDTIQDVFVKMSEGNPGALRVCMDIYNQDGDIDPQGAMPSLSPLLRLDDMGIYGPEIWVLYKDVCNSDIVYLLALLRSNQLGHIGKGQIRSAIRGLSDFDLESILDDVRKKLPDFAPTSVVANDGAE